MAKSKSPKKDKKSKEKSPKKEKKDKKKKTSRAPYNAAEERAVKVDDIQDEQQRTADSNAEKAFGPCQVDMTECKTAVLMLQAEEAHVVIGALNCLQKFLKKDIANCELFVDQEGITQLAKLINSNNRVIKRLAMKCLTLAAKVHKGKMVMRDMELIGDFLKLSQSPDEVVQEYATLLMSELAAIYTGRLQLIQNQALPVLLQFLDHPDPDIIRNALDALFRILEEPLNAELFRNEEILRPIMKLTDSDYPIVQVTALSVLQKVAQLPAGTEILDKMGLIEKIGEKIKKPEFGDLHRVALKTLLNMAQSNTCCAKMCSILDFVVQLISTTSDERALMHAIKLCGKVACVPSNSALLMDSGFGDKLVEFLACDNMKLVSSAALASAQMSACDGRAMRYLLRGMESMLDYLEHPEVTKEGFEAVMATLSHVLSSGKPAGHLFLEWGGKDTLKRIMKQHSEYSDEVLISTMTCVHQLGMHWALRPFIADNEIIAGILGIMDHTANPQVLVACASALTGLLCELSVLVTFLDSGGITQVIKMIQHPEYPVVAAVVPIIHIAGTYQDVAYEMIANGVLEELWKRQDLVSAQGPFRTAFERLLCSNLSAKFAIAGHLDPFEKLPDGFHDYGAVKNPDDFLLIGAIKPSSEANIKKIIYLNLTTSVDKALMENNPIFNTMIEQNHTAQNLYDQIRQIIDNDGVKSEKDLVRIIANVVCDRFGGFMDKWRISYEAEELEMANLQSRYSSVVIPITMMSAGAHRPRSILFKAMADAFGIPCSLERGGYHKVWNIVLLRSKKAVKKCNCSKPCEGDMQGRRECEGIGEDKNVVHTEKLRRFIVDLAHRPGTLLPMHSYASNAYCFF